MAKTEQIDELFAKLEEERGALLETVAAIGEKQAEQRPPEGDGEAGWSIKEQLAHLAEMDSNYRAWIRRAIGEDRPDVSDGRTPTEPPAVPLGGAHGASLAELVAQIGHERAATLDFARTVDLEQYDRTATQRTFGELTVLQWFRSLYRHDRMHRAQILGEESDYQPRYAPGQQEPRRTTT